MDEAQDAVRRARRSPPPDPANRRGDDAKPAARIYARLQGGRIVFLAGDVHAEAADPALLPDDVVEVTVDQWAAVLADPSAWSLEGGVLVHRPEFGHRPEPTWAAERRRNYPAIGDALDAIFREFDRREANGETIHPAAAAWVASCRGVKAAHPKV